MRQSPTHLIKSLAFTAGTALLFVLISAIRESQTYRFRIDQIDYSSYPEIRVYFTALNPLNLPMIGLTPERVRLKEDGIALTTYRISTADTLNEPFRVAVLVDESGSMKAGGAMDSAREAIVEFLNTMDPAAMVRITTFGDAVQTLADWETPREVAVRRVNSLQAVGTRTLLYDGLANVMTAMKAEVRGRRAIILLTDGRDEGSKLNVDDVATLARDLGVPLFTLAYGPNADSASLERLAQVSGGWAIRAQTPRDLAAFYDSVRRYLMSQYVAVYETRAKPGAERHAISIEFEHAGTSYSAVREFVLPLGLKPTRATRLSGSEAGVQPPGNPPLGALVLGFFTLATVVGALVFASRSGTLVKCEKCGNRLPKGTTECPTCAQATKEQSEKGAATVSLPSAAQEGISRTLVFRKVQQAVGVLRVISGSHSGKEYLLELPRVIVGRSRACDILLDDPSLAPEHFVIRKEDGQYYLSDLGSAAGTLVNGQKVIEKVLLNNGARIQSGDVVLVFRIAETVKSVV